MSAYVERAPTLGLRDLIRCLWTFEDPVGDLEPQRIAPDGCPELIVHLGAPYAEGGAPQPLILFAGQTTRPLTLFSTGPVSVLGVRLMYPAWLIVMITSSSSMRSSMLISPSSISMEVRRASP